MEDEIELKVIDYLAVAKKAIDTAMEMDFRRQKTVAPMMYDKPSNEHTKECKDAYVKRWSIKYYAPPTTPNGICTCDVQSPNVPNQLEQELHCQCHIGIAMCPIHNKQTEQRPEIDEDPEHRCVRADKPKQNPLDAKIEKSLFSRYSTATPHVKGDWSEPIVGGHFEVAGSEPKDSVKSLSNEQIEELKNHLVIWADHPGGRISMSVKAIFEMYHKELGYFPTPQPSVWLKKEDSMEKSYQLGKETAIAVSKPVKWPENMDILDVESKPWAKNEQRKGWNACIEEFKRLNGGE